MLLTVVDGILTGLEPFSPSLGVDPQALTDLGHCTVLPPLVDSHLHLFMSGTIEPKTRQQQLSYGYQQARQVIGRHLDDLFCHGVLGVRDGGDRGGFALRYRLEEQLPTGMTCALAGRAWQRGGRYGGLIGRSSDGDDLASAFFQDQEPGDVVKLVNSGLISLKHSTTRVKPQFDVDEVRALVNAAAKRGLKVMAHANGAEAVESAIQGGCVSIEHGFFMGRENLQRMADTGTFWVPTLFTMKSYRNNLSFAGEDADPLVIDKNIDHQLQQLGMARDLGVRVVLGTDAGSLGVLHGESIVEEMKMFKRAGYTLTETIRCATAEGSKLLGIDSFGELLPGNRATFLVSRGTPAQLPRKLSYLESIYIDGHPSADYQKNPRKHL